MLYQVSLTVSLEATLRPLECPAWLEYLHIWYLGPFWLICFCVVHSLVLQVEERETNVSLGHKTNTPDAKAHVGSVLEHSVCLVTHVTHHLWDISAAPRTPR